MKKTVAAIAALTLSATFGGAAVYGLKDKEFKTPMAAPEDAQVMLCVDTEAKAVHTISTGEAVVVRKIFDGKQWEFTDMVTQQKKRINPDNVANMTCATVDYPIKPGKRAFGG